MRISSLIASEYCPLLARACLLLELCEMSLPEQRNEIGDRDKDCEKVKIRKRQVWEENGKSRFITLLAFRFTHHIFPAEVLLSNALPNKNRQVTDLSHLLWHSEGLEG